MGKFFSACVYLKEKHRQNIFDRKGLSLHYLRSESKTVVII